MVAGDLRQHGRWRVISEGDAEFEVLHDGSEELQPSEIVSLIVRSGWQFRVIGGKNFRVN